LDHEDLELAPSSLQTSRVPMGLAMLPAVVGLIFAAVLAVSADPPRPHLRSVAQCDTLEAIETVPLCERYVEAELASQLGMTRGFSERAREMFTGKEKMLREAREGVIEDAEQARQSHAQAMEWFEVETAKAQATRWQALWPAGGGALLSVLLGAILWWRRPRSHRVRLSQHHLEINGRRLLLADLDEIVLDDVVGHSRTLRVRTAAGQELSVALPAFEPSTDRLDQLLAERVPALEERRQERQDGERLRAEAQEFQAARTKG